MTEAEIEATWLRWAHRQDVEADLPALQAYARGMLTGRIMVAGLDWSDTLELEPRAYLAAGLIMIHDLAQDDESIMREREAFEDALRDWHLKRSIDAGPARPRTGVI